MTTAIPDELTTIELLVLWEAGGDNTLGKAYGAVQLYTVFEREEELLDATQGALLRLLDLGLARFVEASDEVGYTAKRHELSSMTREQLVVALERDRNPAEGDATRKSGTTPRRKAKRCLLRYLRIASRRCLEWCVAPGSSAAADAWASVLSLDGPGHLRAGEVV